MSTLNARMQQKRGTAAELALSNRVYLDGEIVLETDTRQFKIGDGVTPWNSLPYGGIRGEIGPQGPAGPQGVQGPQGSQGVAGPAGATGPQGAQGDPGPQGPIGLTGPQGPQGDPGPQGPAGATGPQGATGAQGPAGAIGPAGPTGGTGPGVATGGTVGQYLRKQSSTDFDTAWDTIDVADVNGLTAALAGKANVLSRDTALIIETDFYNTASPLAQGLSGAAVSSGTIVAQTGEISHPGVVILRDSTTANGGYAISTHTAAFRLAGSEKCVFTFQSRGVRATQSARLGWQDSFSSTLPTDGVYLRITANGTVQSMALVARNSNAETVGASPFAPTVNTWYTAIIEINAAATQATITLFNGAGTQVWTDTVSANIPTAAGRETGWGVLVTESTTDAAADILWLDYARMEINRTIVR